MTTTRQIVARNIAHRGDAQDYTPNKTTKITDIYGMHVFNDSVMKAHLPKNIYKNLKETIERNQALDPSIADIVAAAMKDWAIELGATHYTHWFQPLTGATAEKHDSFLTPQNDGSAIMRFSGTELTQGEPDASSFPSGGIRATFEARGYTAWDPSSSAFVRLNDQGGTLFVPTAFCSYTGEALDKKTPVLRSQEALSNAGVRLLRALGNTEVSLINSTVGLEQEYFLIDAEFFNARPDLVATGRTLYGAAPYKGQSLDDHYFGSIKARVLSFMQDTEQALHKLGVPVKTRHNEVAPGQYEVAPIFERSNVAIDHNMLVMEVMKSIAEKHKFRMLLHEKPFAGLNGSGKHCNWSMADNLGNNLLEPGHTPHENMQFLVILTAILRGIDQYASLLRLTVAHAGNDHRLGANEAPPAIISAFLGDELGSIVEDLAQGSATSSSSKSKIDLGSLVLPDLPKDTTDRNRTSPFAFTGNKFEFRALGASQHVGGPVFFLNTIVADSFDYMAEEINAKMKKGVSIAVAADEVVKGTLKKHIRVVFNGDGYSEAWHKEAAKRGLPNLPGTPEATQEMLSPEAGRLFEKYKVLSRGELEARYNIKLENYIKTLEIEFNAAQDIARTLILPAALEYQSQLAGSVAAAKACGVGGDRQAKLLTDLSNNIEKLLAALEQFEAGLEQIPQGEDFEHADYCREKLIPLMSELREVADSLETQVDDRLWPLPKYREMLFLS